MDGFFKFCGDHEIPVHRVILSAQSPVFKVMFNTDGMVESTTDRMNIEDIDPDTMVNIHKYIL